MAADYDSTYDFWRVDVSEDDFRIGREGISNDFMITSAGRVGIGTNNPSQKLHVVGNARINNGGNYSNINVGSEIYDQLYADNTSAGSFGGGMWFRVTNAAGTGYTDNFRLAENGNVGVGVNQPKDFMWLVILTYKGLFT